MLSETELANTAGTCGSTCTICGLTIACDKTKRDLPLWTHDAVLLVDESLHLCDVPEYHWRQTRLPNIPVGTLFSERPIKRISAQNIVGDHFRLFHPRGAAVVAGVTGSQDTFLQHYLYLPAHRSCSYVVDDFIARKSAAPSPWKESIWTWSKIWDVLRLRAEAQSLTARRVGPRNRYRAVEPNNFFLPWNKQNGHESDPIALNLEDPTMPGDWVEQLALCAGRSPVVQGKEGSFQKQLLQVPLEILDHIFSFVNPLEHLSPSCTRLASSAVWRYAVFSRPALPWLPAVKDGRGPYDAVEGDWEALTRRLAQQDISGPDETSQPLPPSLVNRRRIWRILNSMYPGDTRPVDLFPAEWPLPAEWAPSSRLDDTTYVAKGYPDCIDAHECYQLSIDMGPAEERQRCGHQSCICGRPSNAATPPVSTPQDDPEMLSDLDWTTGPHDHCHGCTRLDARLLRQKCRGRRKHECSQFWTLTELQQLGGESEGLWRTHAAQCRRYTH